MNRVNEYLKEASGTQLWAWYIHDKSLSADEKQAIEDELVKRGNMIR